MTLRTAAAMGLMLALPAAAQDTAAPAGAGTTMTADIMSPDGQRLGNATVAETPSGAMLVKLDLQGVAPGTHGAHIHETGECSPPDFQSAGGHLAGDKEHGVLATNGPHPGDMPNIHVPDSGNLTVEYFVTGLTSDMMSDDDGSAIVIHENPDDYSSQPSGDAGSRLACGTFSQGN